jgi:phage recombination protein Bet
MRTATQRRNGAPAPQLVRRQVTDRERELIKRELLQPEVDRPVTDGEVERFCRQVERTGLDPWTGQIYAQFRRRDGEQRMVVATSIDGLRLIAERTGKYLGQTEVKWCGQDGEWVDVWLADEPPGAAKVGVYKQGAEHPTYAVARYRSYVATKQNGQAVRMWSRNGMPDVMCAKCAEALALRKAFPAETSGLYTTEEMAQADNEREERGEEAPASAPTASPPRQDAPQGPGGGMQAVSEGPVRDSGAAPPHPEARKALGDAIERSGFEGETIKRLSKLRHGTSISDRLSEEQLADLRDTVEAIVVGGIDEGTLKGQITGAEKKEDHDAAVAAFDRWILRRANEARKAAAEREAAGGSEGSPAEPGTGTREERS